jgi:hypothetical protein
MASDAFGTRGWAARRGGELTAGERLVQAREAVADQLAALPAHARRLLLRGRAGRSALMTGRRPPDSELARHALAVAGEASSGALLGHCLRCWLWADLFAQRDRVAFDPELLYVASVLHDLALTDRHRAEPAGGGCFAVHGGDVARTLLLDAGSAEAFAERVAAAITLHMNVRVPVTLGAEAHLLHEAASLDVIGARAGDLPSAARRAVLSAHPRDGLADEFNALLLRERAERPRSRAALLWTFGAQFLVTRNPLDRT